MYRNTEWLIFICSCGANTKAAVIRLGMVEILSFVEKFYGDVKKETFFESCGVADLIATCYGGRNRKCAELFVRTGKVGKVYVNCSQKALLHR